MNLKNKKVLITGATGGIGNSLVKKFNSFGAKVAATGTNEEKLNKLKENYPEVYVEKFRLDEHDKIEDFVNKEERHINYYLEDAKKLLPFKTS